jgi:hypothetical protein
MIMRSFRVVSIHGAPRSGTSWLGKIFDSHPDVAYRFQPLFSYRFKGELTSHSSHRDIEHFFRELYRVEDDEFILQTTQRARGVHPAHFEKNPDSGVLVMKEVRYHYLIETLLREVQDIKIVGIVRHPCGAINSWLKTPREFKPEWNAAMEWRDAQSKNQGRLEEYFGFEKWKELARLFLRFKQTFPDAFYLINYEELVENPMAETEKLFNFVGLPMHCQVTAFIQSSHASEVDDPDSVFRTTDVAARWYQELDPSIRDAILRDVEGTDLAVFL